MITFTTGAIDVHPEALVIVTENDPGLFTDIDGVVAPFDHRNVLPGAAGAAFITTEVPGQKLNWPPVAVIEAVKVVNPSSVIPSQSSSMLLHNSVAPGWMEALVSSQSVLSATYPTGGTGFTEVMLLFGLPYVSLSASA